ncbi:MAG: CoA transferase [Dehalococcoidia bacterium]|jgi:crotonobetainyl-CoA:carnitine CoA-transferase CaiB-like acyl-CoA transferase|nr:MAG: CoA transferase [Dehalococcoidia bacterium]|tara:strand:- start:7329 stop:8561 length:1233 start_codon:yes stop_codon:yes gene_type:complete
MSDWGIDLTTAQGPLAGLKVLDLSIIVAGGTASSLMADFGAEVVKVERPGTGDPLRNWGPFANGVSLWWKVHSRNKKSITLNLGSPEGQDLLKKLAVEADVLIEGFRPGAMEKWGLGPDSLLDVNPKLVILRYSGFGQTGPYKDRPGFGTIAECMSGYIGMTGFPDTAPNLPPIPLADEIAGVFGAMAGMMALYHRDTSSNSDTKGQVVDVSLFEPLFRLCIPHITMFDLLGINRERVGNDFPDAAPRNLYKTADDRWLGLSATSQSTFESLAKAMGMPDLIEKEAYKDNAARLENRQNLNVELQGWLGERDLDETMEQLIPSGGVVGPVYDAPQIISDPHYQAREDIIDIDDPQLGKTKMLGVVPKFSVTPGSVEHAGPTIGEHNRLIYGSWLNLDDTQLADLSDQGTI